MPFISLVISPVGRCPLRPVLKSQSSSDTFPSFMRLVVAGTGSFKGEREKEGREKVIREGEEKGESRNGWMKRGCRRRQSGGQIWAILPELLLIPQSSPDRDPETISVATSFSLSCWTVTDSYKGSGQGKIVQEVNGAFWHWAIISLFSSCSSLLLKGFSLFPITAVS